MKYDLCYRNAYIKKNFLGWNIAYNIDELIDDMFKN